MRRRALARRDKLKSRSDGFITVENPTPLKLRRGLTPGENQRGKYGTMAGCTGLQQALVSERFRQKLVGVLSSDVKVGPSGKGEAL